MNILDYMKLQCLGLKIIILEFECSRKTTLLWLNVKYFLPSLMFEPLVPSCGTVLGGCEPFGPIWGMLGRRERAREF